MSWLSRIKKLFRSPEKAVSVTVTQDGLSVSSEAEAVATLSWDELDEVYVYTLPYRMLVPCIFWRLEGCNGEVDFPDRAVGAREAAKVLYDLPGFDMHAYQRSLEGMLSEPIRVWKRERN
ncbi:hypothetical protein [Coraliomargarita parva]|uniref:hypothetical protein n=1 Tax=Coraliomargarita parva TaxID=3014050 RepID=UPI0022B5CDDB|nr:hypothetical protein [Coraliomargarita parva]